jgi:NitT/TauT family transport system permease protein
MMAGVAQKAVRYLVSVLVLIFIWVSVSRLLSVPYYLLPWPGDVAKTLWAEHGMFIRATQFTLRNAMVGALIGIVLGVSTGLLVAYSKMLRWIIEPYLVIFQSFPRESLFPLFIVWLGFGSITKMVNAALLSFFPIALMTLNGLLDVREDYVMLVRGWGATRFEEFIHCRLPAYVPTLVSAVKIAFPLALIGAVLGEFLGANQGLGYIIISSGSAFRTDRLFGAIVILAVLGVSILIVIQAIQDTFLTRFNQE